MHCIEESTCETVGSFGALGIVPSRYALVYLSKTMELSAFYWKNTKETVARRFTYQLWRCDYAI